MHFYRLLQNPCYIIVTSLLHIIAVTVFCFHMLSHSYYNILLQFSVITHYYVIIMYYYMITDYDKFIITYYYIIILPLLRHYYSLLQIHYYVL